MTLSRSAGALLIALLLPCAIASGEKPWAVYHNARFDYAISYPEDLFTPLEEADNGDGRKFSSKDGRAEILVFGSNNSFNESLYSRFLQAQKPGKEKPPRVVTYKAQAGAGYAVSGYVGDRIFYEKLLLSNGSFKTFLMMYDRKARRKYDPIVARMARTFRG